MPSRNHEEMAEIFRAGINAVPQGQIEAARAMGMPPLKLAWRVTFPQMLAAAIPGLANLWLIATKDTAILAVVGYGELLKFTPLIRGMIIEGRLWHTGKVCFETLGHHYDFRSFINKRGQQCP